MNVDIVLLLFTAAIGGAAFLFEWSMLRSFYGQEADRKAQLRKRLNNLRQTIRMETGDSILRQDMLDRESWLNNLRFINTLILQTGQRTTVQRFLIMTAASALGGAFLGWASTREPLTAIALALVFAPIPYLMLLKQRKQRLAAFDEHLSEALDITVRALRAGHPFDTSLQLVSEEMPNPISEEYAITYAELSYGVPLKVALENLLLRMPSHPLKAFVTAVLIQRETGGNLAEVLDKISHVIRGTYRFQRKVKTLTAEGRISAMVLAAVPIVLGGIIFVIRPDLMMTLFQTPRGHNLLIYSAVSFTVGYFWIRYLIRIDV